MVRKWAWVGIVLFVIADAVLIVVALRHTRGAANAAPATITVVQQPSSSLTTTPLADTSMSALSIAAPTSATSSAASTSTSASSTATSTTSTARTTAARGPAVDRVLMDMATDGSMIRATRGSCPATDNGKAPSVQVSDDYGAHWTEVPAKVAGDSSAVVRVAARGGGRSWFVAADSDCELVEHDASAGAKDWSTSSPDGAWALAADPTAKQVLAPSGMADIDCVPVYLAPVDAKAAVAACGDGTIFATSDGAKTWSKSAPIEGVVAMTFLGANRGYAVAATSECGAEVFVTTDGTSSWDDGTCVPGGTAQGITAAGDTVLVQVGGTIERSDDQGATW